MMEKKSIGLMNEARNIFIFTSHVKEGSRRERSQSDESE
jgi:hypothetical protein